MDPPLDVSHLIPQDRSFLHDDVIDLSLEAVERVASTYQNALVGWQAHPFLLIYFEKGASILDFASLVLRFDRREDRDAVWHGGPWTVAGHLG